MSDLQHTIEEFTRQAAGFADAPQIRDEDALRLVCTLTNAGAQDTVLDVACGPGILTCALAERVRQATGIDVTPAMIERAQQLQREKRLGNIEWRIGEAAPLPWPDGSFSLVVCRYAFHHFRDPAEVLREMKRVCRPGGRLCVIDVALPGDKAQAEEFNRMERLRDPSHVRALQPGEFFDMFAAAGLPKPECAHYRLEFQVEALLAGSFPVEAEEETIRRMFTDSVETDSMGLNPTVRDGEIWCSYPITVFVSNNPEHAITAESLYTRIKGLLEDEKSRIFAEINNYPQPIAGCDAQFSHLLEQRTSIFQELRRLEDPELRRSLNRLDEFIRASRFLDNGLNVFSDKGSLLDANPPGRARGR